MATWQNTSLIMIRNMINDAGCGDVTYTNTRLEQLLITSAYFLPMEINFSNTYVVSIEAQSISPDPINQTDGADFISFMVLRSACMLDESLFRNAALMQGIKARCGPAILETGGYGQQLRYLIEQGPCKAYEKLKNDYNFGYNGARVIRAIMSPFASNDFDPMGQSRNTY